MSDVVERAKAALECVTEGPWRWDEETEYLVDPNGSEVPSFNRFNTEFIATARSLVPDLVAELVDAHAENARLRQVGKRLDAVTEVAASYRFLQSQQILEILHPGEQFGGRS